ncbi:hypothetical protein C1646_749846 [Rhizophagus diaphanus]|nr:hypothetical protein C1646_749846 [Rhizophagus diaphanus] [Rhizophagus sp. MUCL 43196]
MSCSKIFSGELSELTYDILKYFKNDFSTLYSCILVNRLWCRLTIPFSNPAKNYNFIEIYLHNLNEDSKTKLNEDNLFTSNTLFNYPNEVNNFERLIQMLLFKLFIDNETNLHTFEIETFYNIINLDKIFGQLKVLESVHLIYCHSLNTSFIQQIININRQFKLKSLIIDEKSQIVFQLLLQKCVGYLENFGCEFGVQDKLLLESIIKY